MERPGGGIGRHACLRSMCRMACKFDSCPGHQIKRIPVGDYFYLAFLCFTIFLK